MPESNIGLCFHWSSNRAHIIYYWSVVCTCDYKRFMFVSCCKSLSVSLVIIDGSLWWSLLNLVRHTDGLWCRPLPLHLLARSVCVLACHDYFNVIFCVPCSYSFCTPVETKQEITGRLRNIVGFGLNVCHAHRVLPLHTTTAKKKSGFPWNALQGRKSGIFGTG